MDVNEKIVNTLKPLISNVWFQTKLDTGAEVYVIFNYEDDRCEQFADNRPQVDVAYLQIHFFCGLADDVFMYKKEIRRLLFEAGFSYARITHTFEQVTQQQHLIFQCHIAGIPD